MKVIITESKYEEGILNFIKSNFYPDYDWGAHLHTFYKQEVETYGEIEFFIDDVTAYEYYMEYPKLGSDRVLRIYSVVSQTLNMMFGERWVPIFKKWFEENSGLMVDFVHVTTDGELKIIEF